MREICTSGSMSGEGKRSDWQSLKPPRLSSTLPMRSVWQIVISELWLATVPLADFQIPVSEVPRFQQIHPPPDHFACDECLGEMNNSRDRRFRYFFINCTQCGPRYTLIQRPLMIAPAKFEPVSV